MRDEWLSEHLYPLDSMWILLVEGEEAGQAAANVAWYFFKASVVSLVQVAASASGPFRRLLLPSERGDVGGRVKGNGNATNELVLALG
ncbi:hypothetical protein PFLUV_G00063110 [Perca fluviatilis]|uniref:Uncharacterized protein n=1 Tax=Perca fluviatilis TaxID=8168 RepID=A0A6A5FG62_PERFL|nr:hypothetical protein PFLUV_G00063110 [Perca fluviatilis]